MIATIIVALFFNALIDYHIMCLLNKRIDAANARIESLERSVL